MADPLTQPIAERIISSLEDGVPSVEDVQYFSSTSNPLDPTINSDLVKISSGKFGATIKKSGVLALSTIVR